MLLDAIGRGIAEAASANSKKDSVYLSLVCHAQVNRMSLQNRGTMRIFTPVAIACGIIALATRPAASLGALAVTLSTGVIGALAVVPRREDQGTTGRLRFVSPLALGVGALILARWLRPPLPIVPLTISSVGASALAALSEEIFFRRLVYGWLARWGTAVAIGGSAAAFAVVHVPAYGLLALPIDLAVGVLFGWQRWVTGGWATPAFTHMVANLLQFVP